ncbi:TetR/AcrR family transcriptional regulator [Methylobacterium nonmethylotrophicum]|uniref:TetR/AcrR family transcriptional regulator n=1 Tax=Methylobacterium nonmethylotrophicum TaxID=1141884 RepID=A0A4Z0NT69_9HYPH|nr:TetR/AcrR family transcriptional regulator [Methylobacterium nonmethylotrophicum]TGD99665.1 TetR/AcrR family transcriptional regulator [Methylobacterium nonmethylotrophicum]
MAAARIRTRSDSVHAVRRRLDPEARVQMIVEGAVAFFATRGFDGQLKDLAEALGISQALIFTYFGSKQGLLDRVYDHVYTSRWDERWLDALADRSNPLELRLIVFYEAYLDAIDDPVWIRIVMQSGLAGNELTRRYVSARVEAQIGRVMEEVRHEFGITSDIMEDDDLHERVWDLQSSFVWGLVRKHVWLLPVMDDRARLVRGRVAFFLAGFSQFARTSPPAGPRATIKSGRRARS